MQSMFHRIPLRARTNPPVRSQIAIRVRLWSPARKPGMSMTGRPPPAGACGQRRRSVVDSHSETNRGRGGASGMPSRGKVPASVLTP